MGRDRRHPRHDFARRLLDWLWPQVPARRPSGSRGNMDVPQVAQQHLSNGATEAAVRVYLRAGMYREAANLLKNTGHVQSAARCYVEAKAFDLAEGCFLTLGDRLNAARCAAAAGQ